MKGYIIIPIIISILGHGAFFSIFKGSVPDKKIRSLPNLYIVSTSQIEHEMTNSIVLTPLVSVLTGKNSIWSDNLDLARPFKKERDLLEEFPAGLGKKEQVVEEHVPFKLEKSRLLRRLPVLETLEELPKEKVLPRFSDLFYYRLPSEVAKSSREQIIYLSENIQLNYYIQGPVSYRNLHTANLSLEIKKVPVELKLRFWVSRNGTVNQVVIEEGSGFPIIDKNFVDNIKEWRFSPIYSPKASEYEWGVIKIRIQG